MAETLVDIVLERLVSFVAGEIGLICGVGEEMNKLSSKLTTIKTVLEDAEQKQLQDKAIKIWLRKLKQAVYEIDDVLDESTTKAAQLEFKRHNSGSLNKVCACFLSCYSIPDNFLFRHRIGNKMKEINENLDAIANERMQFHLQEVVVVNRVEIPEWRETTSFLNEGDVVYGREKDKESIIEQLVMRASECQGVSVFPIHGIGGLGKTTLAQLVFNDERVIKHFEPRIWVCVSEDFEVKRVLKLIIESVCRKSCDISSLNLLQRQLQDKLNGKRYLLVLDDVWNDDEQKWDTLKSILAYGSSIITTTRLEKVASIMGTLPTHRLSNLLKDDCWLLFKQGAFQGKDETPILVMIGEEIVKKCRGVPLAAKALGRLMHFKIKESEWLRVKESEIWNLPQDDESYIILH
ncbi:putative disease resistance protein RGA3 [Cornus florida]|uniref:putative disease resistance protein RGA3 n=1 Tax=Cornus florida TaxID=4283 RepID=UPI00289E8060|nr:putative disease resistance protein RGA3 [Cornus florida]